jgi:hypothetical protein
MAPEIISGECFNEKVDVFSYAMCLLEVCVPHFTHFTHTARCTPNAVSPTPFVQRRCRPHHSLCARVTLIAPYVAAGVVLPPVDGLRQRGVHPAQDLAWRAPRGPGAPRSAMPCYAMRALLSSVERAGRFCPLLTWAPRDRRRAAAAGGRWRRHPRAHLPMLGAAADAAPLLPRDRAAGARAHGRGGTGRRSGAGGCRMNGRMAEGMDGWMDCYYY